MYKSLFSVFRLACFVIVFSVSSASVRADDTPVTIAMSDAGWFPFYQLENAETNTPVGMWPDMLNLLFEETMNLPVRYMLKPWQRAQNAVKYGDADILLTIPTPSRKTYTYVTDVPLYRLSFHLYIYANHPKNAEIKNIRTIEDLGKLGLTFVSNTGNRWFKENVEAKGIKTYWVDNDQKIARFLALKRADAVIDVAASFNPILRELGLNDRVVQTDVTFGPIDFYILVGKKSPHVNKLPEINRLLKKLDSNGSFAAIHAKYK